MIKLLCHSRAHNRMCVIMGPTVHFSKLRSGKYYCIIHVHLYEHITHWILVCSHDTDATINKHTLSIFKTRVYIKAYKVQHKGEQSSSFHGFNALQGCSHTAAQE